MGFAYDSAIAHLDLESDHPEWNDSINPNRSPRTMGWRWVIQGNRDRWYLEITDERPPMKGRPYRLDPQGDPQFFDWARGWGLDVQDKIHVTVTTLLTYMDEKLLGQSEAIEAYERGNTVDDFPWIHTSC